MDTATLVCLSGLRRVAVVALLLAWCAPGGTRAADLSGMWWIKDRSEIAKLKHDALPFTPFGVDEYRKNRADIASGKGLAVERSNRSSCC